jgi:hypothetical protein
MHGVATMYIRNTAFDVHCFVLLAAVYVYFEYGEV